MATNFYELATTLKYLGAEKKKINFMPCIQSRTFRSPRSPRSPPYKLAGISKFGDYFKFKHPKRY